MKFFDKNKKSGAKKPKRQPDPILNEKKKTSEKLGSSQKKRLEKKIKNQFSKKQKSNFKKKPEESEDEVQNSTEEIVKDSDEEIVKDSDEEIVKDSDEEIVKDSDEEIVKDSDEEMMDISENQIEVKDLNDFNLNNDDNDETNDFDEMIDSDMDDDDDEDVNDNEDVESIIEDENEEDDIVTNINVGDDVIKVSDLDSLNSRIKTNMTILEDYKSYKAKNKCQPRLFYVTQFIDDLCIKFSYNKFLMKKLYDIFNTDLFKFLVASEEDRPITIRANTLKTRRRELTTALINRECNVENLKFTKDGMVVFTTKCAIGATPEYLAGHYLLQGSSSMLPVMALKPKRGERVLDMCAAPGGKTTHIAQMMANTGIVFANDVNKDRLRAVSCNLARMGVMNTIITCHDGRNIHSRIKNFDRVLCDAPCTGTGVISKDKSIKASKDESDLKRMTGIQKQLLCAAIDACKVGGIIVYSTCSVLVEENEQVVDYACRKRNVKLVDTELFGTKGFTNFCSMHFNKNMDLTRRYYPHENNMDGFFVAKLEKIAEKTVVQDKNSK